MTKAKKIYISCDHAVLPLKNSIINHITDFSIIDLGTKDEDSVDYPDYADQVSIKVSSDANALGILVCGSGQGMAMRANKYTKIRAALCWSEEVAKLAREHNDANILCLGSMTTDHELALKITDIFLKTDFAGGRHQQRIEKLNAKPKC